MLEEKYDFMERDAAEHMSAEVQYGAPTRCKWHGTGLGT
eukprot:COSAG01_NODE_28476_length_660_cov_0.983957_2_plen_38_part_01